MWSWSKWMKKNNARKSIEHPKHKSQETPSNVTLTSNLEYIDSKKIRKSVEGTLVSFTDRNKAIKFSVKHTPVDASTSKEVEFKASEEELCKSENVPSELMHLKRRTQFVTSPSMTSFVLRQATSSLGTINPTTLTCFDRYFFRFCSPRKSFQSAVNGVQKYMKCVNLEWKPIQQLLQWPKLPGGQHKKVEGFNYVSHSIWMLAYATGTYSEDDKESLCRESYEQIVLHAEKLGTLLKNFVTPVNELEEMYGPFDQMSKILSVDSNSKQPAYFGVDAAEIFRETLIPPLKRFKKKDFLKLLIYSRDVSKEDWVDLRNVDSEEQMTRIKTGLSNTTEKLQLIMDKIPDILLKLQNAGGNKSRTIPSLFPHVLKMQKCLKDMLRTASVSFDEERLLTLAFTSAQEDMLYIIDEAVYFLTNVWEIILMVRLAYVYVQNGPYSFGTLRSYDEVLKRAKMNDNRLEPKIQYSWEQFYDVDCPSLLRKVPVIIGTTVELSIHLDGFSNPERIVPRKKSVWQTNSGEAPKGKSLIRSASQQSST